MSKGVYFIDSMQHAPSDATLLQTGPSITKVSLLKALSTVCRFPDYFGYNWDAAWDLLESVPEVHLLLKVEKSDIISKPDLDIFIDMIDDASREYGNIGLWVYGYGKVLRTDFDS